ncbi:T9SS type A sorting domain-containing protein [Pontibacter sp. 13R65]|uniref:T9SS type A sorting domain-containing protein n=1 Tax=Pontibacter sp. 13R65 TaxID=3127458 RepID=UPI00301C7AD3
MKHKNVILCTALVLGLGLGQANAQVGIPASGGDASGGGGTVSFSIGQVVFSTYEGEAGSVEQGVQCAYEISVVTNAKRLGSSGSTDLLSVKSSNPADLIDLSAYPNPTTDVLTLRVGNYRDEALQYQLYDVKGRLVESKEITGNLTSISMLNLAHEVYFLKITKGKESIKTFKIIKH